MSARSSGPKETNKVAESKQSLLLIAASPSVWALHFLLSYCTAAVWCAKVATPDAPFTPVRVSIAIYTGVALLLIAGIGGLGFRRHRLGKSNPPHDADTPEDRYRFLGYSSLLLSGLSAIAVIYAALTLAFIGSCH